MEIINTLISFVLHIDKHLAEIIQYFGNWTYGILFAIIFCETGLVVTPFLPGDSLLFAVGTFAATGSFNIFWLTIILMVAAVIGDSVNYAIGKYFGHYLINHKMTARFIKKEYLDKTHSFYERHGGKTIILARFVPIVRTFAPFVAGIGEMSYIKFFSYNVIGGIVWVALFTLAGYFFGNIPIIRENFTIVIYIIIFISILPPIIEIWRHRSKK